jgi:peptide/nickel transport system permease protein
LSVVTAAGAPGVEVRDRTSVGKSLLRAVLSNRKALIGTVILVIFTIVALFPHLFTPVRNPEIRQFGLSLPPSSAHPLGTTPFGQDIFAQLIYGTRESLLIAVIAGFFATVLSVVIGVTAAYAGGLTDGLLSLLTDVFLVLPTFPLIIVLAAYAGHTSLTIMIIVLVVTGWSYGARQLRAQALSLRNRDFLESARVRGERSSYIIFAELLPTMSSLILANFLGAAVYAVLTDAGLRFLGLGDPAAVSWGTMLYWAQNQSALQTGEPWWALAPGLCVAALGAAFALINYAFDEISNPALRPVRRRRRGR